MCCCAGSPALPLSRQRRQAGRLVRGLGADDRDLKASAEASGQPQGQSTLAPLAALDLLTPDGLPFLGWHPGDLREVPEEGKEQGKTMAVL